MKIYLYQTKSLNITGTDGHKVKAETTVTDLKIKQAFFLPSVPYGSNRPRASQLGPPTVTCEGGRGAEGTAVASSRPRQPQPTIRTHRHTHLCLPSKEGRKEGWHEAAECERVDLNAGETKAAPGPRPSMHTATIQHTSVPLSCTRS